MKKFALILMVHFGLIGPMLSQDEVIVGWTFPGNSLVADTGISVNLTQEISTFGGTSAIEFKNGFTTKAVEASGWDNGMNTKGWLISFSSEGFTNLTVSSRQQSGGNDPGPKDFKIQYSIDNGTTWTDVVGGIIIVQNDWTTSFVDNLSMPGECQNQTVVMIRWLMASNEASGAGGPVTATGKSKIDDIYIRGESLNGIEDLQFVKVEIMPNPASDFITINSNSQLSKLSIADMSGRQIMQKALSGNTEKLDVSGLSAGIYFLSVCDKGSNIIHSGKIIIH
jgi:hypothetical protein